MNHLLGLAGRFSSPSEDFLSTRSTTVDNTKVSVLVKKVEWTRRGLGSYPEENHYPGHWKAFSLKLANTYLGNLFSTLSSSFLTVLRRKLEYFTLISVATTLTVGILNYNTLKENLAEISQDARSVYNWLCRRSVSHAGSQQHTSGTAVWTFERSAPLISRVQLLFAAASIAVEACKAYQGNDIKEQLKHIADQIRVSNLLQAQGSRGPDEFALHVLDFLELKVAEYSSDGKSHRFSIYHPGSLCVRVH
ncbi:hypothetical protein B0I37DRAFT_404996 [Chaetomium sp. MPI-CAGE-AT-0009]|nr:hypothetical protein B0I37DRAFT_404996 [Chaetomium sp. MPI-CAGE-AT-0009]